MLIFAWLRHRGLLPLIVLTAALPLLLALGPARPGKGPEITSVTVVPEMPVKGQEVSITVSAVDPTGVRGVVLKAGSVSLKKSCGNERECTVEFVQKVPERLAGSISVSVTAQSRVGRKTTVKRTITIAEATSPPDQAPSKPEPEDLPVEQRAAGDLADNPLGVAFGSHFKGERFMHLIRDLGAGRTYVNITWGQVEPQPGAYTWDLVERFIDQLEPGIEAMIRIRTLSSWAVNGTVPKDWERYEKAVRGIVEHTRGKVRYFESDWEMDLPNHWSGTAEEYLKLMRIFHRAVKETNPDAVVVCGGHTGAFKRGRPNREAFLVKVLEEGHPYFDYIDVHLYEHVHDIPERLGWFVAKFRDMGVNKKILVAESGGPTPLELAESDLERVRPAIQRDIGVFAAGLKNFEDRIRIYAPGVPKELEEKRHRMQSRQVVQRSLLALSSGADMIYWWNLITRKHNVQGKNVRHPIFGKLRLMETEELKTPRPAFYAWQRMARQLGNVKRVVRLPASRDDVFAFRVENRRGEDVYVIWQERDIFRGEDSPPLSYRFEVEWTKVKSLDTFGREEILDADDGKVTLQLTDTPIFLRQQA